jgi:hypothetical protein
VVLSSSAAQASLRGIAFEFRIYNQATGEWCIGGYTASYSVTIIAQGSNSGANNTFVTGSPSAGQVQIADDAGAGIKLACGATRNGNICDVTMSGMRAGA